jgi:hypothetical protein
MYNSIYTGILICILISIGLTIYSYYSNVPRIKIHELKLTQNEILLLYGTRLSHLFTTLMTIFVTFIVLFGLYDTKTNVISCLFLIIAYVVIHTLWKVLYECPLSIVEKNILHPRSIRITPWYEPWAITISGEFPKNDNYMKTVKFIWLIALIRACHKVYKNKQIVLSLFKMK